MQSEGGDKPERFSSGGVAVGVLGLVLVAAVLLVGALDTRGGFPAWGYPGGVFAAMAIWAVMIRPAVLLGAHELELRNVLHSRWIPYRLITDVTITQVTTIRTADARYVGSGLGRSRRTLRRDGAGETATRPDKMSLGRLVEDTIERRVKATREGWREPETAAADPQVRRAWAWPEILLLAGSAAATAVLALLG